MLRFVVTENSLCGVKASELPFTRQARQLRRLSHRLFAQPCFCFSLALAMAKSFKMPSRDPLGGPFGGEDCFENAIYSLNRSDLAQGCTGRSYVVNRVEDSHRSIAANERITRKVTRMSVKTR